MAHVLLVYGTTEGQTAKIAEHIAAEGRRLGHTVRVAHAPELGDDVQLAGYDAALLGASIHEGHYQRAVKAFATLHRDWLATHPSAFFSVSLSAASRDADEVAAVQKIIDDFCAECHFKPSLTASFAGALKYTEYSWLKRAIMKQISKREGGSTDTSRDHEYTDWSQVTRFAERFFKELVS